jgi:hypothetical protein
LAPGREKEYGWVNWTVAVDTPDLVYYQSYLDFGLGWKINVLDEGEVPNGDVDVQCRLLASVVAASLVLHILHRINDN